MKANKLPFTDAQTDAIAYAGSMVITACPGSGKTTVMVEKIRGEFDSLKRHQGVIGISFTIKSSDELAIKCKRNGANVKSSFFGTIDNFCLVEIIFPFAARVFSGVNSELSTKRYSSLEKVYMDCLPDLSIPEINFSTEDCDTYWSEFSKHYDAGFILLEAVTVIAYKILEESAACRRYIMARYCSVYVDEYQDTSEPQHSLFLKLHSLGLKSVAVGDIQQSIFAFRGSDPSHLLSLVADSHSFEHHVLDVNHRSHPSIVNYANRLYSPSCHLLPVNKINVFHRTFTGSQINVAVDLDGWIRKSAEILKIEDFSDIAILVRWNSAIDCLQKNLSIPARFYKDDHLSKLSSPVGRFFAALLYFYYDERKLVEEVLDAFPVVKVNTGKLISLRKSIASIRQLPLSDISSAFASLTIFFNFPREFSAEITALQETIASTDELAHYEKVKSGEVQVMTLHKSKGLEFDMVLHLDLYDWVFPKRAYTGDFNEEVFPEWDQDLNLHYVGVTRAKKWCVLITSKQRVNSDGDIKKGNPSKFLSLPGLAGLYR
ncbi:UvrD-helicase domain-containing protein [Pseudomonas psychrophila]|uniref:UvrD-helicase domain-containing protein n=1 Tax=Pseudomonas psychrophila TaxID=122355 RepID=UPI003821B478